MSKASLFWNRVLGPTIARYGWYLVVIPLAMANLGAFRAASETKIYKAATTMTIGSTLADIAIGQPDTTDRVSINRELGVALSRETITRVRAVPGTVFTGRVVADTNQIVLEASSRTPAGARDAANALAKAYISESLRRRAIAFDKAASYFASGLASAEREFARADPSRRAFYQGRVNDLRARMLDAQDQASKPLNTTIVQETPAALPGAPSNRSVAVSAILGFIFGLGLCGALILILDFGEKQRVTLDDVARLRPNLPILGVSRGSNLRSASLVGHGVRTAAMVADTSMVCTAFIGSRVTSSPLTDGLVQSLRHAGVRAVQIRVVEAPKLGKPRLDKVSDSLWNLALGSPSQAIDGKELLSKGAVDSQTDLLVIHGPVMRDKRATFAPFELADQIVLMIDSTSASEVQCNEALLVLEAFNRPILGAIFLPK
jgi:hypothetical protein